MNRKCRVTLEILERAALDEIGELEWRSIRWDRPNGGGPEYASNEVTIDVGKDGHISFRSNNSENFIYFYPEQVAHLRTAMRRIPAHRRRP